MIRSIRTARPGSQTGSRRGVRCRRRQPCRRRAPVWAAPRIYQRSRNGAQVAWRHGRASSLPVSATARRQRERRCSGALAQPRWRRLTARPPSPTSPELSRRSVEGSGTEQVDCRPLEGHRSTQVAREQSRQARAMRSVRVIGEDVGVVQVDGELPRPAVCIDPEVVSLKHVSPGLVRSSFKCPSYASTTIRPVDTGLMLTLTKLELSWRHTERPIVSGPGVRPRPLSTFLSGGTGCASGGHRVARCCLSMIAVPLTSAPGRAYTAGRSSARS
jgi:hypothetical protein